MKKIISLVIIATLFWGAVSAFADEADTRFGVLKAFGIMEGYGNGDLGLDRYVTRAEFTKMAIAASNYRNAVTSSLSVSPFPDVTYDKWHAPYVYLGVSNGLLAGYKDGTFKPDSPVLYEEGVTILLRLLGYEDSEFAYSWPTGQIGMAERIGLCDGVKAVAGQALTRNQVSYLFYNLLNAQSKNSADYITALNHTILSDTVLISSYLQSDAVKRGYVNTSAGTYEVSEDFDYSLVGCKGDVIVKDKKIISFIPESTNKSVYNIFSVSGQNIILFKDGVISDYKLNSDEVLYYEGVKTTVGEMLQSFTPGDVIELHCDKNWDLEYVTYSESSLEGPVVVKNTDWYKNTALSENASVIRDGVMSNLTDINVNDVVYYSETLQSVWATGKKVSGIYDAALPNSDRISQIKISGVTYTLNCVDAFIKLSSGGIYKQGDRITLILDREGNVCDVLSGDFGESYTVYQVVGSNIIVCKNGQLSTLELKNSDTVYFGSQVTTVGNIKNQLDLGYVIDVTRDTNGSVSYITVSESNLDGPYTAEAGDTGIDIDENTIIMKRGARINESSIEYGDILYYSKTLNMVWAYSDTVTGVYESATPNQDTPSSVVVSGKTYEIEGISAYNALSSNGFASYGDTVILLLGKDGRVADVLNPDENTESTMAYVISGGSKEFTNSKGESYSSPYVLLLKADGTTAEYESKLDYSKYYKDEVAVLSFEEGRAVLSELSSDIYSGTFSAADYLLGNNVVDKNVQIVDVVKGNSTSTAVYTKVFPQRIDGVTLSNRDILYAGVNSAGKIDTLFLNNVTGDAYSYGIVTKADNVSGGMNISGSYTYFSGSTKATVNTSGKSFSVYAGAPVQIKTAGAGVEVMTKLTDLGEVKSIGLSTLTINGKNYKYTSDIAIYKHNGTEYQAITMDELRSSLDDKSIFAYAENSDISRNRIRVLVIK